MCSIGAQQLAFDVRFSPVLPDDLPLEVARELRVGVRYERSVLQDCHRVVETRYGGGLVEGYLVEGEVSEVEAEPDGRGHARGRSRGQIEPCETVRSGRRHERLAEPHHVHDAIGAIAG